jgi:acyl-CoA dehydrogenase
VVREIQGGKGYVGEFVIHRLYRDVQGHPVQSGTANVLSLDLLERSRRSAHDVPSPLVADSLDEVDRPGLDALATTVRNRFETRHEGLLALTTEDGGRRP